jgi:hypothetical protein
MVEVITDLKPIGVLMAENNKGNNRTIMQGGLLFLCAVLLLNEIYPPLKFQVDTSITLFEISSGQKV